MRNAIAGILKDDLHIGTIAEASDGLTGLRLLKNTPFSIVLLDWMMPRMDGYNFARTVRKHPILYNTKIIMITSKRAIKDVEAILNIGVTGYIVKPFEKNTLIEKVQKVLESYEVSEQETIMLKKAEFYMKAQHYAEAARYYALAAGTVPARLDTKVKMARASLRHGDISSADATMNDVMKSRLEPQFARSVGSFYTELGDHFYKEQRYPDASDRYSKAIDIDPMQDEAYTGLGNIEEKSGNPDAAKKYFDAADSLSTPEGKVNKAKHYINAGDIESADDVLSGIEKTDVSTTVSKTVGSLLTGIGYYYFDNNRIPEAEKKYSDALTHNPRQRDAYIGLGEIELKRNNISGAGKYFDEASSLDVEEEDMQMFNKMAIRHRRSGRPDEAIKVLERAISHFPDDAVLYYNLGRAYLDNKNQEMAISHFKDALKLDPTLVEAEEMLILVKKRGG